LLLPSTTFNPSLSWNWLASSSPPPITLGFLPDFTEHPKPKRQKTVVVDPPKPKLPLSGADGSADDQDEEGEVTFLQDFMAGGMAGSASVIVGHPLDTLKVRVQNSAATSTSLMASITEYGGFSSLFRGMGAPLSAAAVVNAIVFSSYGIASRLYDCYVIDSASTSSSSNHDPWQKAMSCGAFAGLVQCVVICPMEHVKCRLQVQQDSGPSSGSKYKGPYQATKRIVREHGLRRLYQGWWSTVSREVPAFGLYFAVYDYMKDNVNTLLAQQQKIQPQQQQRTQQPSFHIGIDLTTPANVTSMTTTTVQAPLPEVSSLYHTHTWIASALAGGIAGSVTWGIVYPVDVSTFSPSFELFRLLSTSSLTRMSAVLYLFLPPPYSQDQGKGLRKNVIFLECCTCRNSHTVCVCSHRSKHLPWTHRSGICPCIESVHRSPLSTGGGACSEDWASR
jgi:solute carrier family 25 carnitine/acylcarnitine transporter 20/29